MVDTGGINFLAAFMLGTVALLVMAIGIISFVLVYQRRVITHQLEIQKKDEEMQREMLRATIQSQEEEQRRIARDLHDDLGPMLSAIKLKTGQIKKKMEASNLNVTDADESQQMIDTTITQVRGISHRLFPPVLEYNGLADTIEDMCEKIHGDKLNLAFTKPEEYNRISNEKELAVYRVVMELLNNIIRHSQASKASITLTQSSNNSIEILVSDNGKGFDTKNINQKAGLGLKSILSRIAAIKGHIKFESSPGNTLVTINVNGN